MGKGEGGSDGVNVDGLNVGIMDCLTLGNRVGCVLGTVVGGLVEGLLDGEIDGLFVGLDVLGRHVGMEGITVGARDGEDVGDFDGRIVGG